jgi:hypothetical protein
MASFAANRPAKCIEGVDFPSQKDISLAVNAFCLKRSPCFSSS